MPVARTNFQELTIKNNFMFAAVMLEEANCRALLECIFGRKIGHVDISYEKSIVYHPEYKGVRLDVFCEDEAQTHYNVEMQVADKEIRKRVRRRKLAKQTIEAVW